MFGGRKSFSISLSKVTSEMLLLPFKKKILRDKIKSSSEIAKINHHRKIGLEKKEHFIARTGNYQSRFSGCVTSIN